MPKSTIVLMLNLDANCSQYEISYMCSLVNLLYLKTFFFSKKNRQSGSQHATKYRGDIIESRGVWLK